MKITSLLVLAAMLAPAQGFDPINQELIDARLGLIWLKTGEEKEFAISLAFNGLKSTRLYAGQLINLKITDAVGNEIASKNYYDFNKGRSAVFCEFEQMPQGNWVHITGDVSASAKYFEQEFKLQIGTSLQSVQGKGYSFSCSAPKSNEFVLHEKGFTHLTWMDFVTADGTSIEPLYNKMLSNTGVSRDMAFVFADDVDVSKLSLLVKRREAKNPQIVPVDLRFNVAGQSVAKNAPKQNAQPVQIASLPKGMGKLSWERYNVASRAGVSRGRYQATNIGLVLTPDAGSELKIEPKQRIIFKDGAGNSFPARLEFVTPRDKGGLLLTFSNDAVPQGVPFALEGDLKVSIQGKPSQLPVKFEVSGFPKN